MRTSKELMHASKQFACENRLRSWLEVSSSLVITGGVFAGLLLFPSLHWTLRIVLSVVLGLLHVRLFVLYHDFQHRAILTNSAVAALLMNSLGVFLLAPPTIWKRSHEHHHNHNSKLTMSGIGSYPTISTKRYLELSRREKTLYLINRHPLTVIFGYITLFIYWLNLKSFFESPRRHLDSLAAIVFHLVAAWSIGYWFGLTTLFIAWVFPFFITYGMGAYLFYCQHNFPGAKFRENHDWRYDSAAIESTSCMRMSPLMHWFTANIGYHHIHHLNSRIPFYRLIEAANSMPELKNVPTTSWNLMEIIRCFSLKLWDAEKGEMITLRQLNPR